MFKPGDAWFRTGDLMRQDERGFFYFVDRIGDTFRWKGENVATSEVAEAIARCPGVRDATVYGVAIPGTDGRAGMAALVVADGFDLAALRRHIDASLPAYARPVFLRVRTELETTATFKHKKDELARAGYDPGATKIRSGSTIRGCRLTFGWTRRCSTHSVRAGAGRDYSASGELAPSSS